MTQITQLPRMLNIPPKLEPVLTEFNSYKYFLVMGGRNSGKSQSIGRILLYIAEHRKVRIVCGREQQNSIEESVYALLVDLITSENLNYAVTKSKITHRISQSTFTFKGFREQGKVNIKGLEGVDILWIDESQSVTKPTLDIIIPTIRKQNARLIFTMNRYMRDDAVPEHIIGRPDALVIEINYYDNPHCTLDMKNEALTLKERSERDYNHIYLGVPLATADDYLFNIDKLHEAFRAEPMGDFFGRQRVLGIDFAAQGNDRCVATVLDRLTAQHWTPVERLPWDENDTMVSVGKIIGLIGTYKPDVTVIDVGGMGKPVYDRLVEATKGLVNIVPYDGGSTEGVDQNHYGNIRASSYYTTKDWFDQGYLILDERKDKSVVKEFEKIKMKYQSNGVRYIQSKKDMKKEMGYSPDEADSLNMAIWGACHHLGRPANRNDIQSSIQTVTRKSTSRRPSVVRVGGQRKR